MLISFVLSVLFFQSFLEGSFVLPVSPSADILVQILPSHAELQLQCNTQNPKTISQWNETLDADFVFNAGYFDTDFSPLGFAKTAQKTWGTTGDHPAVFGVHVLGEVGIFVSDEQITYKNTDFISGASSFPILIQNGKNMFPNETGKSARRTIIAVKDGRILLFSSVRGRITLAESARFLERFGVTTALNLDGGPSTGFTSSKRTIPSLVLPCVFMVSL